MKTQLKRFGIRILLGAIPVLAFILALPPGTARADVFSDLFGTTQWLGSMLSAVQGASQGLSDVRQNLVYPLNVIQREQTYISSIIGSYRPWMSQVYNLPFNSAQQPASSQLEAILRVGKSSDTADIARSFQATYGASIPSGWASAPNRQTTDMNDAHAIDALSLATATDQSSANLISLANQLEDQSATTAAGTADLIVASALALQLQSLATQHKLLAAELRQEAATLATRNAEIKAGVATSQNMNGVVQNLFKAVH